MPGRELAPGNGRRPCATRRSRGTLAVVMRLLIANRSEIAIRIARSAAEMGIATVAVHSEDDAESLHVRRADEARPLSGTGPAAYLNAEAIVRAALASGCDAVHPCYGFRSESADFACRCRAAGLTYAGPSPEALDLFGDKVRARVLAERCGVPVLSGTSGPTSLAEARAFLDSLGEGGAIMVKAVAGGGGRGTRPVRRPDELEAAYVRCQSEARQAFGQGDVYVERLLPRARHVEVQIIGDASGEVAHLWERECTLQRQRQKLIEVAPAPSLQPELRARLLEAALRLARAARYENVGTVEFLLDAGADGGQMAFAFIEANARLQVEHTVTEEVTGIDLVRLQLELAAGRSLRDLGLDERSVPAPRGIAMQVRINVETMGGDGASRPASGTIATFEAPSGPGVRD